LTICIVGGARAMYELLQVLSTLLVSVGMALSHAHALDSPC
jgi:hypothetical protein